MGVTIGLLIDALDGNYHTALLCGAADAARDRDASFVCFAGGMLSSPYRFHGQRNVVYDLVDPSFIDGLVVMSGTIGNYIGHAELEAFCRRFAPIPMCSVAVPIQGTPTVLVDNATGMREALLHLITTHGRNKIAFVRGPEFNQEAERRYRVYREVLAEHGLPLNTDYVAAGDFQVEGGGDAVRLLLDQRGVELDAVVASNDYMALGVIEALRARDIRVPDDVLVVGFDDIEDARFSTPALTTVRQPIYDSGRQAILAVLRQVMGEAVAWTITLETQLVVRRSCGCGAERAAALSSRSSPPVSSVSDVVPASAIIVAISAAHRALRGEISTGQIRRSVAAFVSDLVESSAGSFERAFEDLLNERAPALADASVWQTAISALRDALTPALADPMLRQRAEDMWHSARVMAATAVEQLQAQHRLLVERWATTLGETTAALVTTFDLTALVRIVSRELPRLGIESCFVALYEHGLGGEPGARLVLAYDDGKLLDIDREPSPTSPRELLSHVLRSHERRIAAIVQPLSFQEEQLGFVVLRMGPRDGMIYEVLRDQLSGALKGALLVKQVVEHDRERQRLVQDLEQRAIELQSANEILKQNQQQLINAERMASLGRLTASIAHEVNTPLAAIRATLANLENLVHEYELSRDDPGVTAEDHAHIARDMREEIRIADSASERAAQFVRGIKTQTREPEGSDQVEFDAVSCAREALLLLGYALRKVNCRVELATSAERIALLGAPGRFAQVVTNLVANAIDASVATAADEITIALRETGAAVELDVSDAGCGIAPEHLSRIFDPAFTTKPLGHGTGLGLAIVHDIVTGHFGGSVRVQSELGRGTTFFVRLPQRGS
jgi:DNA-binding LacI/PurR family transcriptional regulator/signal transduction histidine kinase